MRHRLTAPIIDGQAHATRTEGSTSLEWYAEVEPNHSRWVCSCGKDFNSEESAAAHLRKYNR